MEKEYVSILHFHMVFTTMGFYSSSGMKAWSSDIFYKVLQNWIVILLKEVKAPKPVRLTPLICSWHSEHPPHPSLWILQMANSNHCHKTEDKKKDNNNFKIKKRQFTTTLILNIFLQLYYAGFPRGLQTNLYKEIISSTIELQPLATEICLPEFSNTIQQSGHEKLHTVEITEGV